MPGSYCIGELFLAALRDRLSGWEKVVLWILLGVAIGFGAIVEIRSAFLQSRHTDFDVYLRGAWTVRTGGDNLYTIRDDNGWPYLYPPLFAIVMAPLADPPAGVSRVGYVPYAFSVGLWYVVCVGCLAWGVHILAKACARAWQADYGKYSRGWWAMRMVPLLLCLPGIGSDLARGQVNMLVLLMLGLMIASAMGGTARGSLRAGAFLGGAICLKVFPVFLLIYPLWRRDWHWLASSVAVMVLGLVVVPVAVLGPARTGLYYQQFGQLTLGSALMGRGDTLHTAETSNTADNQSLIAIIQNTLFGHEMRDYVPQDYVMRIRMVAMAIGAVLVATTLLATWAQRGPPEVHLSARRTALTLSALILVMLLMSPVCHMAYFGLCLPLVMGLLATLLEPGSWAGAASGRWHKVLLGALAANVIVGLLVRLPGLDALRHLGLAMYGMLALWWVGVLAIRRERAVGLVEAV